MVRSRRKPEARPLQFHQTFHWRLVFLIVFFFALFAAIVARVFTLAIVEHRKFALAAERQQEITEILPSRRGVIFGQDKTGALHALAAEKTVFTLVAVPKNIKEPEAVASRITGILKIPAADIAAKLSARDDPYEIIAKKLDGGTADKIRSMSIAGISLVEESRRNYPEGTAAASLIGFASYNNGEERGEYGIERQYDGYLKGERGFFEGDKDASGYWVAIGRRILNPPVDGDDVVLTIDTNVQFKVEKELESLIKKWEAESAAGLALDPKTGRVLAIASRPTFDPNFYSAEKDFSVFRNPIVDSQFELGSVFKPVTMSAAIEAGAVTATTTYQDPGRMRFGSFTLSNFDGQSHGVQTMTQVLEKSLNTGAIFAMQRLGKERFFDAVKKFGFGVKTGIDFPGEVGGDISTLESMRDVDYATASFGQGIAVTPLQIASAIGAIANGGVMMKPHLVDRIIDANGAEEIRRPQEIGRVVSPATAETVSKMLVSVVDHGFDNRAGVNGYFVAAKTGTAQVPSKTGRGYTDEFIHTFVGYAPAFDPRFLILIQLNKPRGNKFAANTLVSSFHNLAEFILNYYEVPPDKAER